MDTQPAISSASKSLSDLLFLGLVILLTLSLTGNVWLGRLVREGKAEQSPLSAPVEASLGGQPKLTNVLDLDGRPYKIDSSRPTLIYYFSPTCPWCKLNLPSIQSLTAQSHGRFQILGMVANSNGVKHYTEGQGLKFPVVVDSDSYDQSAMDVRGTPQTILVVDGKVTHNWPGAYQSKVRQSIEDNLKVALPELASRAK